MKPINYLLRRSLQGLTAARFLFFEEQCRDCIKNKKQEKRKCSLTYGYSKPSCKLMDKFIEEKNKKINEEILKESLRSLFRQI